MKKAAAELNFEAAAEYRDKMVAELTQVRPSDFADVPKDAVAAGTALIAVAHGGLIREVLGHASGGTVPEPGKRIPNASVHELLVDDGALLLRSHATV